MAIDVKWTVKNREMALIYFRLFVHIVTQHQRLFVWPPLLHMHDPATVTHLQRFGVLKRNRRSKPN